MILERVHQHIISELGQSSRTDTIFVVVAVLFNLLVLGINSAVSGIAAANDTGGGVADVVLIVFIFMTIVVNGVAVVGLYLGRQTRNRLLAGLLTMYADHEVDKYYDSSLVSNYGTRYILFGVIIIALALTAIVVPFVIRFL